MKENMPDEGNLIAAYAWSRDSTEDLTQAVESAEHAIAKIKAKAWDEGFSKGWDRGHYESGDETNPYR